MDPIRLVEAVTAGVALLAAGVMVFSGGRIKGATTGASMWLAASIGLAAGLGFWAISLATCVIGVLILAALVRVENALGMKSDSAAGDKDADQ